MRTVGLLLAIASVAAAASPEPGPFSLVFEGGKTRASGALQRAGAERGQLRFTDEASSLSIRESVIPDGLDRPYRRTLVTVTNDGKSDAHLDRIVLLDILSPGRARVEGKFPGSPVVAGNAFYGVEHPLADNRVTGGRIQCALPVIAALKPGESVSASLVEGWAKEPSQLRRTFENYIEHERVRPYRPFLHHNTWYNLGYGNPFSEADELGIISAFGRELIEKRGVKMDGFVLDDGWDNTRSLWHFGAGWPDGMKAMQKAAERYGAEPGIWLSPWGGYGKARQARLEAAAPEGFEIRNGTFSLSGPKYFERFRDLCAGVVRNYGVAYFKFDGIGGSSAGKIDPAAARDFDAMLRLVSELRSLRPGLYVSQTTGTWPSPWWLFHVDNIWRGGNDHNFAGVGTDRQRWITYRDSQTYANVVQKGPLYPLNSLMVHGIIYATKAKNLGTDPGDDFRSEVREYFGTGTQLQEMYLSPELLSDKNWDDLAAAAKWSRENASVLRDTHWIGGDPAKLEVYGWAAWNPQKGIVTLRNPSDQPASFRLDARWAFELPQGAAARFQVRSPYPDSVPELTQASADIPATIHLKPFEVLVLEFTPQA